MACSKGDYNSIAIGIITFPHITSARKVAKSLLEKRLVACINIIKNIDSIYWWNKKIEKSKEVLILLKTRKNKMRDVVREVGKMHPYEVPEIIFLPLIFGNRRYLQWINKEVNGINKL